MAAHSSSFIRLRLHFDYPPPAVVDCRMCWLLVDLNKCRVVADLESIIREKFEFSRRSILSLFLEDCYLPHTESIYVVRDNDSIRVKVDCVAQVNGHDVCPSTQTENCRKRHRVTEEDGPDEHDVSVERKKKKKSKSEESPAEGIKRVPCDEGSKKSHVKHAEKKKKKKKKKDAEENRSAAATPDPAPSPKKPQKASVKSSKKPQVTQAKARKASSSDSSSSSSSEDDKAPKKPAAKKLTSTPTAPKPALNVKPAQKKSNPPSSSSSDSSSSDEATSEKTQPEKNKPLNAPKAPPVLLQPTNCAQKPAASGIPPPQDKDADSDSEEEIQLVIKRPPAQPVLGGQFPWRGRGRGNARWGGASGGGGGGGGGPPGERGRGAGRGRVRGHGGSFEPCYNGTRESSYHTDTLTNKSEIFQNKPESAPKPDYSSMPLLAAPPQVGQKIAFKLLELTENYTPEVSEYKEGKMVSFDPTTKQIEIELLNACQAPAEPGKFDLVYQNPDGSESVEYTVSRGSWVTERWESLLEPRLII